MEQDTGALPRRSARLAVRSRSVVPPRTKYQQQRFSKQTTPAASITDAVATAKAQQEAAEAERQRLANEAAAQAQQTAEADAAARDRQGLYANCLIGLPLFSLSLPSPYSVTTGTSQVPHQLRLMSMEQDTGALPRCSARLAVRSRSVVPPRTKYQQQRFSRRTTPAASSTAITVLGTTGALPACPVQGAFEPLADYLRRLQAFTNAVATAKAQQEAAEAERQRLANEAAAQAQQTAEADAAARDRRNAASTESLIQSENQWTTLLQGMIFVPTDAQAPTPAETERSNLANLMLSMMRGVMWNNKLLQAHLLTDRQHKQKQQQDIAALTTAVHAAATQQQQQHQLLNSALACINSIEAKTSAAPGCTTDTVKQLNERIDHVVTIIGELGEFTSPATISNTVAAIKTDITKL
ncbi:hypothetical protein CBR_g50363 [Chara braunii]|uniref:Uncharacterized protein n=1 Tax=Chara braunii TaxID=69332 RepID=A0A388K5K2_CHABU|nr:hypothetical protein CBR_g50363 [Chara braunii]|eukprot:GBG65327.1 hypothetical protein CBR_g50363 [Chara braunii]